MKPKNYTASVLRYQPSYVLGELINVGIFYWFEEERKADFCFLNASALKKKLNTLAPQANPEIVLNTLKSYQKIARHIAKDDMFLPSNFKDLLLTYYGIPQGHSFIFGNTQIGTYTDKNALLARDEQLFFTNTPTASNLLVSDAKNGLLKIFKTKINFFPKLKEVLIPDKEIPIANSKISFDYAWQNGSLNLVQIMDFNLQGEQYIEDKAYRWVGKLHRLRESAEQNNLKFNFLTAAPENPSFEKVYTESLEMLCATLPNNRIERIPDYDLDNYIAKIQQYAHPLA